MFLRSKGKEPYCYLQLVENRREGKRTVQRVLCTLGRVDELTVNGGTDALARFTQQVRIVDGYRGGQLEAGAVRQLGPDLVFGRLWRESGIPSVLQELLAQRQLRPSPWSEPSTSPCCTGCWSQARIGGRSGDAGRWSFQYRAMCWLGDAKDQVEERLFALRRDLFTEVSLAFFGTTTLSFAGWGGENRGQRGHSKDHCPDLHQLVLGAVLTQEGRPIASEVWPGNTADVTTLLRVVDRLRQRSACARCAGWLTAA